MSAGLPLSVVKVGGANLDRPAYLERLGGELEARRARQEHVILVHGGGVDISALHEQLDEPFVTVEGLRVTSERGMDITTMALCGLVNKRLVAALVKRDLPAVGISGVDAGLFHCELLDERRLGRVGGSPRVRVDAVRRLLEAGFLPVVAPVSLGPDGNLVNVNADTAACALASALRADRLDFLSDVPGVRIRKDDPAIVRRLTVDDARDLLRVDTVIRGGMRPKLTSAIAAARGGVGKVRVGTLTSIPRGECTEVVA